MTTQEIKERITNKHFRFSIDKLSIFLSELFSRVEELEKTNQKDLDGFFGDKMRYDNPLFKKEVKEEVNGGICSKCGAWKGGSYGMNGNGEQTSHKCKEEVKEWLPEIGETYYSIISDGTVEWYKWNNDRWDNQVKSFLGIYRTKAETERVRDQIKELIKNNV